MKNFRSSQRKKYGYGGVVLTAILFLSVNAILFFTPLPVFDITQNKLFTLSELSVRAIDKIKEPVEITFYHSGFEDESSLPFQAYSAYVSKFLTVLANRSDKRIIFQDKIVTPFSNEEDQAVFEGLKPIDGHFENGTAVFAGIVLKTPSDRKRVIATLNPNEDFFPQERLAHEITALVRTKKPLVGVIGATANLPNSAVMQSVSKVFDIRYISRNILEIPSDIDVLMTVNPTNLNEETLYAVDQYLMQGGKAVFFLDVLDKGQKPRSNLAKLLEPQGIFFDTQKVVADNVFARFVPTDETGDTFTRRVFDLSLNKRAFSPFFDFSQINRLHVSKAGAFKITSFFDDIQTVAFLASSKQVINVPVKTDETQAAIRLQEENFAASPLILGVALQGKLNSAFEKPVQKNILKNKDSAHLSKADKPARLILTGDSDLLYDEQSLVNKNGDLSINSPDNALFVVKLLEAANEGFPVVQTELLRKYKRPFVFKESVKRRQSEQEYLRLRKQQDITVAVLNKLRQKAAHTQNAVIKRDIQEQTDALNKKLVALRTAARRIKSVQSADRIVLKQKLFALNVFFVPFLLLTCAAVLFMRRSRRS